MAIVITYNQSATILADFSCSPEDQIARMGKIKDFEGNAAIQNALEICCNLFQRDTPAYCRKEILVVFSSCFVLSLEAKCVFLK